MSNQNVVGQINNIYRSVLKKMRDSAIETPVTSYSVNLCSIFMLPVLLNLQIIDKNDNLGENILTNAYIVTTTNFLLKYFGDDKILSQVVDNAFNLLFMFNNPMLLNYQCLSDVFNYMAVNKKLEIKEYLDIIRHMSSCIFLTYLIGGKIIPGFIDGDNYVDMTYVFPILRMYSKDNRYRIQDFEKAMRILYIFPKSHLCNLHSFFSYMFNKIGFNYKNRFINLQDFVLSVHAFLEEYSGLKIYSLSEVMSITSYNPYRLENFIFNLVFNKNKIAPVELSKLSKIGKINLSQIPKLIKDKSFILSKIDKNDIEIFVSNIFNLTSSVIPIYTEYQNKFCNQNARLAIRQAALDAFGSVSYDILSLIIEQIFDDERNIDKLANYIVSIDDSYNSRFISTTGSNLICQRFMPLFLGKLGKLDLEVEFNVGDPVDFNSFAYHIPYEIIQGLSYSIEIISLIYNFGYLYSEMLDTKLNNIFGIKNYPEHLAGGILKNTVIRHIPIPEIIKEHLFSNNYKIITYLMYQLSHNMSEFSINYFDLLSANDINFNLLNTFLLTKINTGFVNASANELTSEINSTLYERMCINGYMDMWNSQKDIVVVMSYLGYLAKSIPNLNLVFNVTKYKNVSICLNNLFISDLDYFIQYFKLFKRIVPFSNSLEQAILLRELIANDGCFKYNWLEQTINTLFALSYCVADSEFVLTTISDPKLQKNSGIFSNLFKFAACHYIPKSGYSSYHASHLIQALALNEDIEYSSNSANYYQYFDKSEMHDSFFSPVDGTSGIIGAFDDRFTFVMDNGYERPIKITLGNSSIYNKYMDGDRYYNKACEVINLYEKKKFMLHIMCRYKYIMHVLNSINYIDKSDNKFGIIKLVNIGEVVKFVLYEILCTPFQTSFVQIYRENNAYNIESRKSKSDFIRPITGYLRSSLLFCHHAQIARFHDENGIYQENNIEQLIYIVNAIMSVYHNSTLYNIKNLNKYKYNFRWFRPNNITKNKNRVSILIKANKMYTCDSSLYLGRFTYALAFRIKSNIYTISFAPVLMLMKNIFNRMTNIGILTTKNRYNQEIRYYGSHSVSIGGIIMLMDLLGNQTISRLIAPSKYNVVSEPLFKRYKIRNEFITEYSASNVLYLPLLALQSCDQYVLAEDNGISIFRNKNAAIGIMPLKEFSINILTDIVSTLVVIVMRFIYVFLYLLTALMKAINNLISSTVAKDKILNIEKRLGKEKEDLKSDIKRIQK